MERKPVFAGLNWMIHTFFFVLSLMCHKFLFGFSLFVSFFKLMFLLAYINCAKGAHMHILHFDHTNPFYYSSYSHSPLKIILMGFIILFSYMFKIYFEYTPHHHFLLPSSLLWGPSQTVPL
jgi:hypothetical protein